MTDHELDSFDHQREAKRLFADFERLITAFNTTNISAATGGVTVRQFLEVARVVSLLRAQYLKSVLGLSSVDSLADLQPDALDSIRRQREAYEEALQGFGALRHAMLREYLQLTEDGEEISIAS